MGHDHGAGQVNRRRLLWVLAISGLVLVIEVVAGLVTGSLALLADAGHVASDCFGLVLALVAMSVARISHAPTSRSTFGYHRTEIIAAGANGMLLVGVAVMVVISAARRLGDPPHVDAGPVIVTALIGLTANVAGICLLRGGAEHSLNVRGAYLEVLGDAIGSIAVLVSATVIAVTGWLYADPIASLAIAVLIAPRALSLLRDVVEVLMERTPRGVDLETVRRHMLELDGVVDVHDLHVWTITSGMPVMSAHVTVDESVAAMGDAHTILDRLSDCLHEHFDVEHSTFQIEPVGHRGREHHAHH